MFVRAGIAAFLLTIGAIALEGARFGKLGIGGVFGWVSKDYLPGIGCVPVIAFRMSHVVTRSAHGTQRSAAEHISLLRRYLAVVPGIVGHTGLNTVLKYLSPLVISLSTTTEPLIGACMGAP